MDASRTFFKKIYGKLANITGFGCFAELSGNVSLLKRDPKEGVHPQPTSEGGRQPGCRSSVEPSGQVIGLLEISGQESTGHGQSWEG